MNNFFKRIWKWMKKVWSKFRWLIRKKINRQYRVIRCPDMESMIGMKCYGTPAVNRAIIFTANKGIGHRVITPSNIIKAKEGNLQIYTKYIYIFIKRTK